MEHGSPLSAALLHYGTNDISGPLTAGAVVLTYDTIRTVNKCAPIAAQTITLPSVAVMRDAGWPTGARFTFTRDNQTFSTTFAPFAGDGFFGFIANALILQAGLSDVVHFQLPASGQTKWIVTGLRHHGRSTSTVDPAGGTTTLTAASITETVIVTPTVGGGAIVLPAISALITAGYPPGYEFTIATNGAQVVTVAPNGADTFLAQASPRSFAATLVAHSMTVRMPAVGPGAWVIPAATAT